MKSKLILLLALLSFGCSDDQPDDLTTREFDDLGTQEDLSQPDLGETPDMDAPDESMPVEDMPGSEFDPLTPPSDPDQMLAWKQAFEENSWESLWHCEEAPTTKDLPGSNAHGQPNRVCSNPLLAQQTLAAGEELPEGVAAVKFLQNGGMYVEVKIQPESDGGNGWIWSAPGGGGTIGWGTCTGCHSAAEPADGILGDFVYFQVPSE